MSVDPRKDCRTQGKYSERSQYHEDKRSQKRQDKSKKLSPTVKEVQERKPYKRRSDGGRSSNTSLGSENESSIRYVEENSVHTFSQLKEVKKPVEIKKSGRHTISKTENGESIVYYEPCFLRENEASNLMTILRDSTGWNKKNIVINGEEVPQPRLVAWYGPFPYSYSGATLEPKEMPGAVKEIKEKVEEYLSSNGINVTLNSVLLNLYRSHKDSVAWHSDDELSMGIYPTIASVSLGETRKFEMRFKSTQIRDENSHPKDEEYFIHLTHGSLLIMDGCMQIDWQHRVPKEYHDRDARINLTFRTVYRLEDVPPSLGAFSPNQSCSQVVKKGSGYKADYGIQYDDEDFPPLSNSSPVCSNGRKSAASGGMKSSEWNGSHKGGSNGTSHSKTSLKTNSNDFGDVSSNKSGCKTDRIHSSDKITASEVSQTTVSGSGHYTKPFENNASLKTDSQTYESELFWDTESSPSNNREDRIIDRPENQLVEVSQNKFSCDKIASKNGHYTKPFENSTSLKTDTQTYESEDFWDSESSPSNDRENGIIDRPENQVIEPLCSDAVMRGAILNNLNEDKNNVKIDMENKNLCAYASDFSSNNANVMRKNKNFQTKESHDVNPSSVNSMENNIYAYQANETPSDKNKSWTPNVKAKEFVPTSICNSTVTIPFDTFDLENLLNYTVDLMDRDTLSSYAFALRNKVLERMAEFNRCQEELEVLCDLTDGDQTEKNQKIISRRMCSLVRKSLKYMTSPNYGKSYGNQRRYNQGNQNNFSGRKFYSSSRERTYRQ